MLCHSIYPFSFLTRVTAMSVAPVRMSHLSMATAVATHALVVLGRRNRIMTALGLAVAATSGRIIARLACMPASRASVS